MRIYWCPQTRASRVVWMAEEAGLDYELVHIDVRNPDTAPDEFREASPMGKVPALEDGDSRFAESAAICLYLADRYALGSLAPRLDDVTRGDFLYWMFYSPASMEPAMVMKGGGFESNPGSTGWGSFDKMIETLESGLSAREWLVGDRFTAADVMVGSTAAFLSMFGMMPDSAVLTRYVERCQARPAYRKAMALEAQ